MHFIEANVMGVLDSKGKIGICDINGPDEVIRLKGVLADHEIRVYHVWPYYNDNLTLKYRVDTDDLPDELRCIIKLSFE